MPESVPNRFLPGISRHGFSASGLAITLVACLVLMPQTAGQDEVNPPTDPFDAPAIQKDSSTPGGTSEIAPVLEGLNQVKDWTHRESQRQMTLEKLRTLILPTVTLRHATIEEAVEFLRQKSVELDTTTTDPEKKGISFILRLPSAGKEPVIDSINLTNVSLEAVANAITDETGIVFTARPDEVIVSPPLGEPEFVIKIYPVSPDFLHLDGGAKRALAQQVLEEAGISFPEQAVAYFNPSTDTLSVRNTQANHQLVKEFVESLAARQPKGIILRMECYRMPKDDALALLAPLKSMPDVGIGVSALREIAATSEKIKLLATARLHSRSGQKVQVQSKQGRAQHPENTAFDSFPPDNEMSGELPNSFFSANATLGADGKTLDITADFVLDAPSSAANAELDARSVSINTSMSARQTRLVGTLSGGENDDSMILVFLKASLFGAR